MTLTLLKFFSSALIFPVTLISGFLSIRFATRYRKQLDIGDSLANGIFIGTAVFHLLPAAMNVFHKANITNLCTKTFLLTILSYCLFYLIEKVIMKKEDLTKHQLHIGILMFVLSIHALIAGVNLGLSMNISLVWILFIAILAHKGFEVFAFTISIYRRLGLGWELTTLLIIFSFITPLSITLGMASDKIFHLHITNLMNGIFSAIAAGTFFYIGTTHSHHLNYKYKDIHAQWTKVILTLSGMSLMAILSLFS